MFDLTSDVRLQTTFNATLNETDPFSDPMYIPPDDRPFLSKARRDELTYWVVVIMCIGWAILYSLPGPGPPGAVKHPQRFT